MRVPYTERTRAVWSDSMSTGHALEVETDRGLHDTRRTRGCRRSESRVGLLKLCRTNICGRAGSPGARIYLHQPVSQSAIQSAKVRVVKNVICLPSKLQPMLLTHLEVLEKSDVCIENIGKSA